MVFKEIKKTQSTGTIDEKKKIIDLNDIDRQLNRFYNLINREDRRSVLAGMGGMCELLFHYRLQKNSGEWKAFCRNQLYSHPISRYVFSDPYTRRSFEKPWNYPGDAVLLDYIYRLNPIDGIGSQEKISYVHEFCTNSLASRAVRYRASVISNYIDAINLKTADTNILSVACGHMRELGSIKTIHKKPLAHLIAVDHEDRCYPTIVKDYPWIPNFKFYQTNVLDMIRSVSNYPDIGYDFIYSAGLFDYLSDKTASRLIMRLFNSLKKNGVLLVTNFVPMIPDLGYMESFMDWYLIYRTTEDLERLCEKLSSVASIRSFLDPYSNIAYVELVKLT